MQVYEPSEMLSYVIESDSVKGDLWMCHYNNFTNVAESDEVAFGETPLLALSNFLALQAVAADRKEN